MESYHGRYAMASLFKKICPPTVDTVLAYWLYHTTDIVLVCRLFQSHRTRSMPDSHHLKRPPMVTAGSSSSSLGVRGQGRLARPSYPRSGSSSSSLSGLEQSIQPFQQFIKQTRAVATQKPLPPTPMAPRIPFDSSQLSENRDSGFSESSRPTADRRSSSVYSRTQSQWIPNGQSVESLNTICDTYLASDTYSTGIPNFNIRQATPDSVEPRGFSPLITSPSPTLSAVGTVSKSRPPTFMLSPSGRERPKARLMSLDNANRTFNAPGMIHLLPEEMRAQSSKKSEARKHARVESEQMFNSPRPPPLPPAAIVHQEKRSQSASTGASVSPCTKSPCDAIPQPAGVGYVTSMNTFRVGTGPPREMIPPVTRSVSEDEERGRTTQRGHSSREYPTSQRFFMHDLNPRPTPEQRNDSPRQPSASGSYNSEDDVRGHMKMIPQPLFHAKSPTQHPEPGNARISSPLGYSASRMQRNSQESASSRRPSGFPLRLSLTPPPGGIRHRQSKSSTTGMIPISPPSGNDNGRYHIPSPIDTSPQSAPKHEMKVSSLYPRLMNRHKKKKAKPEIKLIDKRPSIGAPLLPPSVVAEVLLTPDITPQTSPLASNLLLDGLKRTPSGLSTEGRHGPLYHRLKGMTKHARRSSKQQDMCSEEKEESPIASPHAPHFLPSSPTKTSSSHQSTTTTTHLNWTETAKAAWDQARATAVSLRWNHAAVASVDERSEGVERSEVAGEELDASRTTIFTPFVESYRETRAQKRREDLKRRIKVVAPLGESSGDERERERDEVERKKGSWV